jgi:hypothetical protein
VIGECGDCMVEFMCASRWFNAGGYNKWLVEEIMVRNGRVFTRVLFGTPECLPVVSISSFVLDDFGIGRFVDVVSGR